MNLKLNRWLNQLFFLSIHPTGQAKSHKCFLSVKKCSHRKLLQLLNHIQAHTDNAQVPAKTSREKESLQLSKVCLTLTFLLSKTWHIKHEVTPLRSRMKLKLDLPWLMHLIRHCCWEPAAHYHSGCKDGLRDVLGIRRYTENNVVGDICLKLPMFSTNDCPSASVLLFFLPRN